MLKNEDGIDKYKVSEVGVIVACFYTGLQIQDDHVVHLIAREASLPVNLPAAGINQQQE